MEVKQMCFPSAHTSRHMSALGLEKYCFENLVNLISPSFSLNGDNSVGMLANWR